jgi:hypothetical protein
VDNLRVPIQFDASGEWPDMPDLRLVYVVNLFHLISQADATAVISGAANGLAAGGHFFIYGPFRTDGAFRSEGDEKFHASLAAQDASIGYKDLEWMEAAFCASGLSLVAVYEMPANNLAIVVRKALQNCTAGVRSAPLCGDAFCNILRVSFMKKGAR